MRCRLQASNSTARKHSAPACGLETRRPASSFTARTPTRSAFRFDNYGLAGAMLLTSFSPARPEDEINPFRAPVVVFSPCLGHSSYPAEASPVTNQSLGIIV